MHHWAKPKLRTYRIADGINAFLAEFHDPTAFDANQMIVIWHSAAELKCGTFAVKAVFHQNATLGQEIQRRINRGSGNPVAAAVHMDIELVSAEMTVEFGDSIEDQEAFLGASVLLPFEEIRKRGLQRIDVLRWSHGHKYICA